MLSTVSPAFSQEGIELLIVRSEHKLFVVKDNAVIRTFRSAFGSGGREAKLERGDRTTPIGTYRIRNMRDSSRFHIFLQLDYPNIADAIRALDDELINERQYNAILDAHIANKLPPQNTKLGGSIGIHGIGHETKDRIEIHEIADWTQGCIALRNHEVDELMEYIEDGTKVVIVD